MGKFLAALLTGVIALALSMPALAETYKLGTPDDIYAYTLRDDHGEKKPLFNGEHDLSGWETRYGQFPAKLWPDTAYYIVIVTYAESADGRGFDNHACLEVGPQLADSRYFRFSWKAEGSGKKIIEDVNVLQFYDNFVNNRFGGLKLVTGQDTTDDEHVFRLMGKFTVKDDANLEALTDFEEGLGAKLEPGDVIEVDFGRFVVGNRKTASGDVDRDAGEYAMTWDPRDADRNTLLYETEAGTLLEVRLKADTDADMLYLKLNTAWKALEEAGLVPEEAFPDGDAVLYSFEDTGNLLSATSRADIYIHNHPDTALGGEAMTDLFEDGRLYIYDAIVGDDGTAALTDISAKVSVGIVDGEKALRIRDRAFTNVILSTVPFSQG